MNIGTLSIAREWKAADSSHRVDAPEAGFDALESRLSAKVDNVRSSLRTWLTGAIVATAGILIAAIRL
jgi:hypothetical protein